MALITCFLHKHNQDICGNSIVAGTTQYQQIDPFSLKELENFGIVPRIASMEESSNVEIDQKIVKEISSKVQVLSGVIKQMRIENEVFKPLEVILNCPFKGLPKKCQDKCLDSDKLAKVVSEIGLKINDEYKSSHFLQFLSICGKIHNWERNESKLLHLLKKSFMSLQQPFVQWFPSNNEKKKYAQSLSQSSSDHQTMNVLLIAAANALHLVITVLSCSRKELIQTIIPQSGVFRENPFFLAYCPHTALFYHIDKVFPNPLPLTPTEETSDGIPSGLVDKSNVVSSNTMSKKCTCGRGHKEKKSTCQNPRCPCFSSKMGCYGCECLRCNNGFGKSGNELVKLKACRCGESNDTTVFNCKKNRCQCFKNKWSCDASPICKCRKCENDYGRKNEPDVAHKEERAPKRDTGSARKVYRFSKDNSFHEYLGIEKKQSIWTDSETLTLFLCEQEISLCAGRYKKIQNLYNAMSISCTELALRPKKQKQISFKLRNLHSYDNMYNV